MNAIGKFGRFITYYQHPIQISLIVIAVVLVIFFCIRAVDSAKKKENFCQRLTILFRRLTLRSAVLKKKSEVIYIDNRIPAEQAPQVVIKTEPEAPAQEVKTEAEKPLNVQEAKAEDESDVPKEESQPKNNEEDEGNKENEEPENKGHKFFDRSCAVSKNGRTYSIEELKQQIRE